MEVMQINKSIEEQKPLLVSSCLALKGDIVYPDEVESLLLFGNMGKLSFEQILDIASYDSVIGLFGEFKKQNVLVLNGTRALAIANYLLKRISVKEPFIRDEYEVTALCQALDAIFEGEKSANTFSDFMREMFHKLSEISFLNYDNEAFLYLVVNFYLYMSRNQVLIYSDSSDLKEERLYELADWVLKLEG